MRLSVMALIVVLVSCSLAQGVELTEEQEGPWTALEEQVGLDFKQDLEGMKKFMHPKGCFWGDDLPAPVSMKTYSYYAKKRAGEDEGIAHSLVPVSVVVVDDVAIINFYCHVLTKTKEGDQEETIFRGHNTWKKENGQWLLLSTYNTVVDAEEED